MDLRIVNTQATLAQGKRIFFFCARPSSGPMYPMHTPDIPWIHRALKRHFETTLSPVAAFITTRTQDPFRVLVATILSARTKDQTTAVVSERLFREVKNLDDLHKVSRQGLEKLIYPVGFYRTKARMLKQLPDAVATLFGGRIPDRVEDLIRLPGVGRKTANLVVSEAFDKPGICVDVHVHRICNRLGLIRTRTPLETEMTLRQILPKRYWKTWNRYLVALGQTQCTPQRPRCAGCPLYAHCQRIGVSVSQPTST